VNAHPAGPPAAAPTFRHEAFLYSGLDEFMAGALSFIQGGLSAGVPILVVLSAEKLDMLRSELRYDYEQLFFADIAGLGRNPARFLPVWQGFVLKHGAPHRLLRGIGEPIGPQRAGAELVECQRHEALINLALGQMAALWLLCPYDVKALDPKVIDEARRNHPFVVEHGAYRDNPSYHDVTRDPQPFGDPLPDPPDDAFTMQFGIGQLRVLRTLAGHYLGLTGLTKERIEDLILSINEIATNSVQHAGGHGTLRIWQEGGAVLCEVNDDGYIGDPLVGREAPGFGDESSRGFWVVNQLCDLVQVRSSPAGSTVRLHMVVDNGW
jgi:anti-sigma regulatory factor (Ser/Thr protein kinase)